MKLSFFKHFTLKECCSDRVLHRNDIERRLACAFEGLHDSPLLWKNSVQLTEVAPCPLSWGSLPMWGSWKMTNHKRAGVSLGLRPQNVKSLLRASRTPPRANTEERESTHKAAAQLCCVWLLLFTCVHLPLLHSVTEYVREDQTSARGSWNLHVWHGIVYVRERSALVQMCFRSCDIWHKYNAIDDVAGSSSTNSAPPASSLKSAAVRGRYKYIVPASLVFATLTMGIKEQSFSPLSLSSVLRRHIAYFRLSGCWTLTASGASRG